LRHSLLSFVLLFFSAPIWCQITVIGTLKSGGLTRDYRLYKPAIYTGAKPVPLVLNLHGYSSNNFEQEYYGSFHAIADTANFLVVMPNGTIDNQGNRFWNTFGGTSTVNDVKFIDNLIDTLQKTYNIDPQRIYGTGMSNGGFMSYALACQLNRRIAAIASVTGSMIVPNLNACQPKRPVPVMEIHGTADPVVPYTGGTLLNFASVPNVVNAWVNFNKCNQTPLITPVPNTNLTDGSQAERIVYSGGTNGATVEHYKIAGGGHTWPGAAFITGVTNQDFNASYEIWRFFRRYRLDALSNADLPENILTHWDIFPNPNHGTVQVNIQLAESAAVRLEVFNLFGQLQTTGLDARLTAGEHQEQLNLQHLPSGIYLMQINSGASQSVKKLVIED